MVSTVESDRKVLEARGGNLWLKQKRIAKQQWFERVVFGVVHSSALVPPDDLVAFFENAFRVSHG